MTDASHIPVLLEPILEALLPAQRVIDGTLGAGGHSAALLAAGAGELLGLDRDPQALALARTALAPFGERAHIAHVSYIEMQEEAHKLGWDDVDAILLDVGVSSMQFDTPERGFSFRYDAPLDMRFDPTSDTPTAADLINLWDADELADIFYHYGEEHDSRRIARAIVRARPLETTTALASVIERAVPRRRDDKIHPATRVFQALRIAVNDELGLLARVLPLALDLLVTEGRLAVISFHSLEDRIVKDAFRLASTDCICPPKTPVCICGHHASVRLLTKKPITADAAEIARNPRSRSAKLRIVEKLHLETR
ncbi:MAG: 16S rRNA (cytosine(1402)-N(4))-methyltransferase RsmH [Anaerolineae bacterium]|nr:16S rRNA (cytosine(1402)-N(4))-methyltransferase RsmH [Anaerolineae bacterium]MCA9909498.1 16S rRNA (cytosine(1402)-N(4))-methyltransferase RsmH [Anaerolineae bacterium]